MSPEEHKIRLGLKAPAAIAPQNGFRGQQHGEQPQKVQAAFFLAGRKLDADELKDIIPVSFPMTNRCKGFPFIAYYPIEEWDEQQLPRFSQKSWCKLAMMTAEKDMTNLHQCFEVAKKISDTPACL